MVTLNIPNMVYTSSFGIVLATISYFILGSLILVYYFITCFTTLLYYLLRN